MQDTEKEQEQDAQEEMWYTQDYDHEYEYDFDTFTGEFHLLKIAGSMKGMSLNYSKQGEQEESGSYTTEQGEAWERDYWMQDPEFLAELVADQPQPPDYVPHTQGNVLMVGGGEADGEDEGMQGGSLLDTDPQTGALVCRPNRSITPLCINPMVSSPLWCCVPRGSYCQIPEGCWRPLHPLWGFLPHLVLHKGATSCN
jgi:hypothetical protein